jgi:hypothetical protein
VPGQDGPHIEEDTMHPDITQSLAAERIREWRDRAGRDRLLRDARNGRRAASAPAAERLSPLVRFGRRAEVAGTNEHADAAGQRPSPGRRAA